MITSEGKPFSGAARDGALYKAVPMVVQNPHASFHLRHTVDQVPGETLLSHGFGAFDNRIKRPRRAARPALNPNS